MCIHTNQLHGHILKTYMILSGGDLKATFQYLWMHTLYFHLSRSCWESNLKCWVLSWHYDIYCLVSRFLWKHLTATVCEYLKLICPAGSKTLTVAVLQFLISHKQLIWFHWNTKVNIHITNSPVIKKPSPNVHWTPTFAYRHPQEWWVEKTESRGRSSGEGLCVGETFVFSLGFPLHWRFAHLANGIGCNHRIVWGPHTYTQTYTWKKKTKDRWRMGRYGGVTGLVSRDVLWELHQCDNTKRLEREKHDKDVVNR